VRSKVSPSGSSCPILTPTPERPAMAEKKRKKQNLSMRSPNRMMGEKGGARYGIRPIEPTGGGRIGGLLSPSGIGQTNI